MTIMELQILVLSLTFVAEGLLAAVAHNRAVEASYLSRGSRRYAR